MLPPKQKSIWWLLLTAGVIFLIIGIYAFIDPLDSYMKLVKFTGIGLLMNGVLLLTLAILNDKRPNESRWMQAESILHLFFGIIFIFNSLLAFIALPYFIGVWLLLVGILKTLAALALRRSVRGWPLILLVGVLCDLFGFLLLFSPLPKAKAVTVLIGIFGLIMGSLYTIDAFRYRKMTDTLDMLL
jgi:uncharacterized membrane protein HdeD (DUF308 family)